MSLPDKCECWYNPETGQQELCREHEPEMMDKMMEVEAERRPTCEHDRLNEDGMCRRCGADCRGTY